MTPSTGKMKPAAKAAIVLVLGLVLFFLGKAFLPKSTETSKQTDSTSVTVTSADSVVTSQHPNGSNHNVITVQPVEQSTTTTTTTTTVQPTVVVKQKQKVKAQPTIKPKQTAKPKNGERETLDLSNF